MERLFFESQKFTATGYYSIENSLPDVNLKPRLFLIGAAKFRLLVVSTACWLSEPLVVRMDY